MSPGETATSMQTYDNEAMNSYLPFGTLTLKLINVVIASWFSVWRIWSQLVTGPFNSRRSDAMIRWKNKHDEAASNLSALL